jgi:hypothetical protein
MNQLQRQRDKIQRGLEELEGKLSGKIDGIEVKLSGKLDDLGGILSLKLDGLEEKLHAGLRARPVEDARFRALQAQGKVRRFVNSTFRKKEVARAVAQRRGDCNRCGACCEILFKCPFLKKHDDGSSTCGVYENRPEQCRLYPIEPRDLKEVRGSCSFYFIQPRKRFEKVN